MTVKNPQDIWSTTVSLLARREHSAKELETKLTKCGFSKELIRETLEKCFEQNVQSDKRYSEMLLRTRVRQGYGPVRITQELQQQGISASLIDQVVHNDELNWQAHLQQVKEKKFGKNKNCDIEERSKQIRFLTYRGFAMEDIMKLFRSTEQL